MPLRPSVRFEVFKRDGFTCQYCGRKTPAIVLEVDHIIPIAGGGTDDIENLVTACWDCNRGKGARDLDSRAPVPDLEERAGLIMEREAQIRVYNEAKQTERERKDRDFAEVWEHWFDAWSKDELPRWHTPWESTLRAYIEQIGKHEVMDAMDIAQNRFRAIKSDAVRYFVGVLKRKVARQEGRIVPCTVCGKDIVLDHDQDASLGWHHTACEEKRG